MILFAAIMCRRIDAVTALASGVVMVMLRTRCKCRRDGLDHRPLVRPPQSNPAHKIGHHEDILVNVT